MTSTYLRNEPSNWWGRRPLRKASAGPSTSETISPEDEAREQALGSRTVSQLPSLNPETAADIEPVPQIVIHPGNSTLRLGLSSAPYPISTPAVVARRQRDFVPAPVVAAAARVAIPKGRARSEEEEVKVKKSHKRKAYVEDSDSGSESESEGSGEEDKDEDMEEQEEAEVDPSIVLTPSEVVRPPPFQMFSPSLTTCLLHPTDDQKDCLDSKYAASQDASSQTQIHPQRERAVH